MAKILLVEDDTNLSEIYQARMEAEGYTVVAAPDGETALAIAAKEKPDLVISDVMMPKISGFEMLDILRNTQGLKNTKVIMLTALGQADDRTRAESLGADKYLVKSQVTLEDIVSAAHELLNEGNELPTPAELAAPAMTPPPAVPSATNDNSTDDNDATATPMPPAQAAPTGPLSATTPAVMPVVEAPVSPPEPTTGLSQAAQPELASDIPVIPPPAATDVSTAPPDSAAVSPVISTDSDQDSDQDDVPDYTTAPVREPIVAPTPAALGSSGTDAQLPATDTPTLAPSPSDASVEETSAPVPTPALETSEEASPETSAPSSLAEPVTSETVAPNFNANEAETTTPAASVASELTPAETYGTSTTPTNTVIPPVNAIAQPMDENVVADAIDKLLAKAPAEPSASAPTAPVPDLATPSPISVAPTTDESPEPSAVAPEASTPETEAETSSDSDDDRHRPRVIEPLTHTEQPSLQDLLAKEEAQSASDSVEPPAETEQAETPSATTSVASTAPVSDEEAEAAALLAKAQANNTGQTKAAPANDGFDPHSMTL
jgi:CheY-like chemotaxis protein